LSVVIYSDWNIVQYLLLTNYLNALVSETDPVSLIIIIIIFFFFLFFFKIKPKALSFQIGSKWNLARLFMRFDWRNHIFDMTSFFQDGGHDVISRRKRLSSGECTCSVCLTPPASAGCLLLQFLIHSTFVLVNFSVCVYVLCRSVVGTDRYNLELALIIVVLTKHRILVDI